MMTKCLLGKIDLILSVAIHDINVTIATWHMGGGTVIARGLEHQFLAIGRPAGCPIVIIPNGQLLHFGTIYIRGINLRILLPYRRYYKSNLGAVGRPRWLSNSCNI